MAVWAWIAAVWLATAVLTTLTFLAARHSRVVHGWLFGEKAAPEVRRFVPPPVAAPVPAEVTRLAA